MKYFFGTTLVYVFLVVPAMASEFMVTEVSEPYEVIPVSEEMIPTQVHLGVLEGYPVMYEAVLEQDAILDVVLSQRYLSNGEPLKLSFIVVQVDEDGGGVTEVGRLNQTAEEWIVFKESALGMTLWNSKHFTNELAPGIYRIEVSTPDNQGAYMLTLSARQNRVGYDGVGLGDVWKTQQNFGLSPFSILLSSRVYYPLGLIIILLIAHRVWKYRKSITQDVA